jgi:hypothetical protein
MRKLIFAIVTIAVAGCNPTSREDVAGSPFADVELRNTVIDDSIVHTVRSEDVTYVLEITPTADLTFNSTWTVERDGVKVQRTMNYELGVDPDGNVSVVGLDDEAARAAYYAIGVALSGTRVEAALASGTLDFSEGLPEMMHQRDHYWCPTYFELVFACGGGLASCLASAPTPAGLIWCGFSGGWCGYVAAHWVDYCPH